MVRSLHNPFGNGHNVILVGGSDDGGVASATATLIGKLAKAELRSGVFALGWLMEIRLGAGMQVPTDVREIQTWEACARYGSRGYFGWNCISKHMAAYHMTGDAFHARMPRRL